MMEDDLKKVDPVEHAAEILEEMTNVYGCANNLNQLAFKMTRMHRTLVQSFTSGFVIPFIREMAKLKREDRFDGRNEAACDACLSMSEALEKKYDIGADDGISLPLI